MNLLRRLFGYFPKRRANAYEGATTGRRLGRWGISSLGPNTALNDSLTHLRSRSRDLVRNNPWVANGFRSLAANLVGNGITPRWELNNAKLKTKIQQEWFDWTNVADADGQLDFYGLQLLVAQTLMQSGEALVRLIPIRTDSKKTPLKIQVLEPDFLADDIDKTLDNGNRIQMGIELNPWGKRIAYHLYKRHPGEIESVSSETIRIPADEILPIYRLDRPGQLRGVPWIASVLLKLRELDQYEDAELVRKKTAALFAGFITESAPDLARKIKRMNIKN